MPDASARSAILWAGSPGTGVRGSGMGVAGDLERASTIVWRSCGYADGSVRLVWWRVASGTGRRVEGIKDVFHVEDSDVWEN
eukprot:4935477-Prymnesium_polylepis.1